MVLWLYRLLFLPVLCVTAPYYLFRMRKRGGYRRGFQQRFGAVEPLPPKRPDTRRVWLQAVSVGEMLAVAPVLEAFKRLGGVEVYLTTTTSTGHRIAEERYRGLVAGIGYFPTDWWLFSARAWRTVAPDLVILTEGERWPEHIAQARRRGVPVLAVNARLSDRSFRRMRAWRRLTGPLMLRGLSRVLACSEEDAARFRELGVHPDKITVTGNIKWDVTIPPMDAEERERLREEIGLGGAAAGEPVLLGSSTWPGEETALAGALAALREAGLAARLLLVPRHMERRAEVEDALRGTGFSWHLRSRGAAPGTVDIAVGDTTGELRKFAQLADLVFVGKSLPPHTEGQTPVEAAALGKPILMGPGMANFRDITRYLTGAGAARGVRTADELTTMVLRLMATSPEERDAMAGAARACHKANQGAVARTVQVVAAELERHG